MNLGLKTSRRWTWSFPITDPTPTAPMPGSGSVPAGASTGQLHGDPHEGSAVVPKGPEGEVTPVSWRSTPPTVVVVVIVVDGAARMGQ
eukprot:7724532-Heterocapsa_arctica.AAC.1